MCALESPVELRCLAAGPVGFRGPLLVVLCALGCPVQCKVPHASTAAGLHMCLSGKPKRMRLSLKFLVACQGLSAVTLPLAGTECIWVGLGENAALRIYVLVTVNILRIH